MVKAPLSENRFSIYDPLAVPDLCSDYSAELCGKCVRMDFNVRRKT